MLLSAATPFKKKMREGNHRDSNIELLRILAILGVVILHYNNESIGGGLRYVHNGSINEIVLLFLEGLCICAVDLFILISGFFSCNSNRRSSVKIINLLAQYSFFQLLHYIVETIPKDSCSLYGVLRSILPVNYFVILYVILYMISPYINIMLRSLSKLQVKKLIGLVLCLFSIYPTLVCLIEDIVGPLNGLSSIGISGSDGGYTIINFMLVYIIGAGINLTNIKVKKQLVGMVIILNTVLLALWGKVNSSISWMYCNPLVILNSAMIFLLFKDFRISSLLINKLSKASFTCFCVHLIILEKFEIQKAVQASTFYMIGHMSIVCLATYAVSYLAYKIWNIISSPILLRLENIFVKINLDFLINEE